MKWSSIAGGSGAIKSTSFKTLNGKEAKCGIRWLLAIDEAQALSRAGAYAAARGGKSVDGDPLYELGKAIHLIEIACTDLDDPTGETPFFDGGADQIQKGLDVERIFLLKEEQLTHQEETSPHQGKLSLDEYIQAVYACAAAEEGAALPFESWPLRMRRNFSRSMAKQLLDSLQLKSPDGSGSEPKPPAPSA